MSPMFQLCMPRKLALVFTVTAALSGCAMVVEKGAGWLSSSSAAIAVMGARVLLGEANFSRERVGTLQLKSIDGPPVNCFGSLRYTATTSGSIDMSCNDGSQFVLPFQEINQLTGTARGRAGNQPFGLTYGMPAERAAGYLGMPADKLAAPKPAGTASAPAAANN